MNLASHMPPKHWFPTLLALTLLLGTIGFFYWGTLSAMAAIWWRAETYTHGLVVPPISLWLIWKRRGHLAQLHPAASFWPLVPLGLCTFAWLLGDLTAANSITQFAVIGMLVLAVASLIGLKISRELTFPLLFLFFCVPFGDFLMPRLMEWTADFTVLAIRASGIPVFREGQNFVIPSGQWSVVEACSGIRYLIASFTVGTLYAYLTYISLKRRILFILISIAVPIVANWLRAYMIVMLGHLSGNTLAVGVDHLIYGWIFFGIVIILMFMIGSRWSEPHQDQANPPYPASETSQTIGFPWLLTGIMLLLLVSAPTLKNHLQDTTAPGTITLEAPFPTNGWQIGTTDLDWQPSYAEPSARIATTYSKDDRWIGLRVLYYRNQDYERKLITSTNVLARSDDPTWQTIGPRHQQVDFTNESLTLRESRLIQKNSENRYVVWQWYWINGRLTSSNITAKWLTAMNMLFGKGDDSAAILLVAPQAEAAQSLPEFSQDMLPAVYSALVEAQQKKHER